MLTDNILSNLSRLNTDVNLRVQKGIKKGRKMRYNSDEYKPNINRCRNTNWGAKYGIIRNEILAWSLESTANKMTKELTVRTFFPSTREASSNPV